MKISEDRLQRLTGILALGFGIYCLALGVSMTIFGLPEMNLFLLIGCILFAAIYSIYGIFLLLSGKRHMTSFIGIGLIIIFWLPSGFQWYLWPLIVMPFVILILGLILLKTRLG